MRGKWVVATQLIKQSWNDKSKELALLDKCYKHIYIYSFACVCVRIHTHKCVCLCVCGCIDIDTHTCICYVYLHLYVYVCVCVHVYSNIHIKSYNYLLTEWLKMKKRFLGILSLTIQGVVHEARSCEVYMQTILLEVWLHG